MFRGFCRQQASDKFTQKIWIPNLWGKGSKRAKGARNGKEESLVFLTLFPHRFKGLFGFLD